MYFRYPADVSVTHVAIYYTFPLLSYIYGIYLKNVLVRQVKWLDQIPGESRLWIKITEYLESVIVVIDNFVQSRLVHPSCFVVLTTSVLNLAVFSNKLYRTRTIVPNTGGITDFIAGSSIQTRIVSAAAIFARDVTNTGGATVMLLVKKKSRPQVYLWKFTGKDIKETKLKTCDLLYHRARKERKQKSLILP